MGCKGDKSVADCSRKRGNEKTDSLKEQSMILITGKIRMFNGVSQLELL